MQPQRIQTEQLAQAALAFLDRTQIGGQEAETMVLVKNWLRSVAQPPTPDSGERIPTLRAVEAPAPEQQGAA
jgi:hypothetical protein